MCSCAVLICVLRTLRSQLSRSICTFLRLYSFRFADEETAVAIADGAFWRRLVELSNQQQLMAAGTPGTDTFTGTAKSPPNSAGLVPGHAYTVLHAQEGCGARLVQVRHARLNVRISHAEHVF
jgi:hypothetical protein